MNNIASDLVYTWNQILREVDWENSSQYAIIENGYSLFVTLGKLDYHAESLSPEMEQFQANCRQDSVRVFRLSEFDQYPVQFEYGPTSWAQPFLHDLRVGALEALIAVNTDRFKQVVRDILHRHGIETIHESSSTMKVQKDEYIEEINILLEILRMVYEAQTMSQHTKQIALSIRNRFELYQAIKEWLIQQLPLCHIDLSEHYYFIQCPNSYKALELNYWLLPEKLYQRKLLLHRWMEGIEILLNAERKVLSSN